MLYLIIRVLACWRLSKLLTEEVGPYRIFERIRSSTGIVHDANGEVVSYPDYTPWPLYCFRCTSVYMALFSIVAPEWLLKLLAVSGAAIIAEDMINGESGN